MEMNFEITETLCFEIDYLAVRIALMSENFFEALESGDMADDYYRLKKKKKKALKIEVFKRCAAILEKEEEAE